ncbi:hypothetical protein ACVWY3_003027 [Bradyrhizobium sp. USDA 4486]
MGGQSHSSRAAIRGDAARPAYTNLTGAADPPAGHFSLAEAPGMMEESKDAARAVR